MVKGIKRLIPVLTCIVILISCMVVPASALSPSVNPQDSAPKAYPFINGHMFYTVAKDFDAETLFGSSYGLAQFMEPLYDPYTGNFAYLIAQRYDMVEAGPENWIIDQHCYIANDNNTNWKRLHEVYSIRSQEDLTIGYFPWSVTIELEDFGGLWDRSLINKAFYLHGRYQFLTEGEVYCIGDNGELIKHRFYLNGSSNGAQSILYNSTLQQIETATGISAGDPYVMSITLSIPWAIREEQDFHISRLGALTENFYHSPANQPTAVYIEAPFHRPSDPLRPYWWNLLSNSKLVTGIPDIEPPSGGGNVTIDAEDITGFIGGAAEGVFGAQLFGEFSLGSVLTVVFIVGVIFWLLKVFAGG